jgi:hypothetical protein
VRAKHSPSKGGSSSVTCRAIPDCSRKVRDSIVGVTDFCTVPARVLRQKKHASEERLVKRVSATPRGPSWLPLLRTPERSALLRPIPSAAGNCESARAGAPNTGSFMPTAMNACPSHSVFHQRRAHRDSSAPSAEELSGTILGKRRTPLCTVFPETARHMPRIPRATMSRTPAPSTWLCPDPDSSPKTPATQGIPLQRKIPGSQRRVQN